MADAKVIAGAWASRANELVAWALARVFVRTDRYGGYWRDGKGETQKTTCPKVAEPNAVNAGLLTRHFRATCTEHVVGPHAIAPGDAPTGRWAGADIDAHQDEAKSEAVCERNKRYAEHLFRKLAALGFRPLLATWGAGSFHIWVLFAADLPGPVLRAFGQWLVSDAGAFGFPKKVECYPKQAEVPTGKFGSWLRLVGRHHTRDVWAEVFDGTSWLEGAAAVAHVLSLTGDAPGLIPAEARRVAQSAPGANGKHRTEPRRDRESVLDAYKATITLDDVVGWLEKEGHDPYHKERDRVDFTRAGKKPGDQSFNVKVIGGTPITYSFSDNAGIPDNVGLNPVQLRCFLEYGRRDDEAMAKLALVLERELGWHDPEVATSGNSDAPAPAAKTKQVFDDTDVANGRRFACDHANVVRFVADWRQWVVYDGRRWEVDRSETRVEQLAKATVDQMGMGAAVRVGEIAKEIAAAGAGSNDLKALQEQDKKARADLKHAKSAADMRAIGRMLHAARSEPGICVVKGGALFDRRRDLLNCPNGTVELRTGKLREHRRGDFITRLCPTRFTPAARRERYTAFLDLVFHGKPAVAKYVRQFSGCAVTGEVSDQTLHIFNGGGSNGKGVLIATWTAVLGEGEYVHTAAADLLLSDGRGERHPTEKTGLRGAHLVVCSETDEDRYLDEAKMKALTGGDTVTARFMRGDFFQFDATHKLVLLTNNRPRVKGTDHGVWRRLRLTPFAVKFWKDADKELDPKGEYPEQFKADPDLGNLLITTEAEGVLADMVEHATAFYARKGVLNPPSEVTRATAAYRDAEDMIGQFFTAKVRADCNASVKGADFYKAFVAWWEAEGHNPKRVPSATKFGREAKRKFLHSTPHSVVYQVYIVGDGASPPSEGSEGSGQNADRHSRAHAPLEPEPQKASNPRNPRMDEPDPETVGREYW